MISPCRCPRRSIAVVNRRFPAERVTGARRRHAGGLGHLPRFARPISRARHQENAHNIDEPFLRQHESYSRSLLLVWPRTK